MKQLLTILVLLSKLLILNVVSAESFIAVTTGPGLEIDASLQEFVFEQIKQNPSPLIVETDVWSENGNCSIKRNEMRGVVYHGLPEKKANHILETIREKWKTKGYNQYKTNLSFDDNWNPVYDLAIVNGYSDYELLKIYNVSGINYDITNEYVIDQIRAWRKNIDMHFVTFDHARFEAKIDKLNYDTKILATENYALCPDVIDQGYNSMEELIQGISESGYLWCWWD